MEKKCTLHNFSLFAILQPKIIKVEGKKENEKKTMF